MTVGQIGKSVREKSEGEEVVGLIVRRAMWIRNELAAALYRIVKRFTRFYLILFIVFNFLVFRWRDKRAALSTRGE